MGKVVTRKLEDLEKHQVAHAKRLDEAFDHIDRRLGELGERVAKNEGRFGR